MSGETTLLLNGTHTASIHTRRVCCKKSRQCILSTHDEKGKWIYKNSFRYSDTCTLKWPVAQLIMRLNMNQETAGSKNDWLGNRLIIPMSLVKHNKTTLSTDTRKTLLQPKEEIINQRRHSL